MRIKKKIKHFTSLFIALLLFTGFANAQEELSLKKAIEFALQNKADAVKSALDIENSEYKITEARANVLPQVNGAGQLTYNPKLQQMALDIGGQTQVLRMGTPWQSNAAIQLDQQVFNMAAFKGLKAAQSTREFYLLNTNLTEDQIIEKVAQSYFELYKTRSQIKTMDKTIQNTTRVKDVIESLEENGLAKRIDVDRITVTLNNLNSSKTQLNNALQLQENALKYLIGMDISTQISLPNDEFDIQQTLHSKEDIEVNNRIEVQLLEKQGELLKLNKSAISANYYPTIGVSASYGYLSMGERFPYFAGPEKGVHGSDFSAITLNLRVPIFNGMVVRSKVKQADIEIQKFETDLKDTKLALQLEAENAFVQLQNALISLNNQLSNVELAERVLDNVENNYQNGLSSLTDLIDAENAFADAQNNYTSAVMDYKVAEIQLMKAKGELKIYYLK